VLVRSESNARIQPKHKPTININTSPPMHIAPTVTRPLAYKIKATTAHNSLTELKSLGLKRLKAKNLINVPKPSKSNLIMPILILTTAKRTPPATILPNQPPPLKVILNNSTKISPTDLGVQ
jgi:hypothetical protein